MFTYLTAGESHGQMVTAVIKQVPAGIPITAEVINQQLARRQQGYGRGGRMQIETDRVEITSGIRHGLTLGSPITMLIRNKDWANWEQIMAVEPVDEAKTHTAAVATEAPTDSERSRPMTRPRPGHADLPGGIKYNTHDLRNILERASARETAARTAVGAVCRQFLRQLGVEIQSHVVQIGSVQGPTWGELTHHLHSDTASPREGVLAVDPRDEEAIHAYFHQVEASPVRCGDPEAEQEIIRLIDAWRQGGDSVGGVVEVVVTGLPVGLGSHVHWDEKLDGKLAQALISIQGMKGVEFGLGFAGAGLPGSQVHDQIYYQTDRPETGGQFYRSTNRAGGLEGGMTNGEPLVIRVAMKPIPTLMNPLHSVDVATKAEIYASKERADVCAVPAASVVTEAVVGIVLAQAMVQKFGGDSLDEIRRNYRAYQKFVYNY